MSTKQFTEENINENETIKEEATLDTNVTEEIATAPAEEAVEVPEASEANEKCAAEESNEEPAAEEPGKEPASKKSEKPTAKAFGTLEHLTEEQIAKKKKVAAVWDKITTGLLIALMASPVAIIGWIFFYFIAISSGWIGG